MGRPRTYEGQGNDVWQRSVHALMRTGLGYEDIAVALNTPLAAVRAEAAILDAEGLLTTLYRWGLR